MTNIFVDYTCNSQYQCNHNLNFYQLLCQDGKYWANFHRFDLSTILFVFFLQITIPVLVSFNQFDRIVKIVNRVNQQKQETTKLKFKSTGRRVYRYIEYIV